MTAGQKTFPGQTASKRFWQQRSVKILAGIAVCIAVILLSLPFAAKTYLQKWLLENGADAVIIEKVRLNPFTGVVALEGVNVKKDGNTVFSDSTLYLNVGLKNLLTHQALLQQVTLTDLLIDIESSEDGSIRIGSYTTAPGQTGTDAESENALEQVKADNPWIFKAHTINIQNVTVLYRQPDLTVELVIQEALIERISTDPDDRGGNLTLKGTVNGAPINLDLNVVIATPVIGVQGDVLIFEFRLDDLGDLLGKYLKPFRGTAGLGGTVDFTLDEKGGLRVAFDGLIDLDQGDLAGDGWATKGNINYTGKASFVMNHDDMVVEVDGDLQALQAAFDMPDPLIDIDNSNIRIKGKTSVTIAEEVVVDSSASLQLAATSFGMDILKASTGETTWDGHVQVETGTASKELSVRAEGTLNVAEPAYSMDVDSFSMEVSNQMLFWDGNVEYILGIHADSKSFVRTDGILKSEVTAFSIPEMIEIHQEKFNIVGKTEVIIAENIGVFYVGDILLDDSTVELEDITIGHKQLFWSGKTSYEFETENQQTISLDGSLTAEGIYTDIAAMHISQHLFTTKADCALTFPESPEFKGTFSLNGEKMELKKGKTAMLSLAEFSIANARDNGSGGLVAESLQLQQIDMPASTDVPVTVSVPRVTISDIQSPDLLSANIKRLTVEHPLVADAEGKTQFAALKSITVNTIKITKDMTVTAKNIRARKGVFLKEYKKDAMVLLAKLRGRQLSYSFEKGFTCNSVELDSVHGTLVREKSSNSNEKQEKNKKRPAADNTPAKTAATIPVTIKHVKVTGDSGFKFTDESLATPFETVFALTSLEMNDIDLNKPAHRFSYTLKGIFDTYSPLEVEGTCAPLAANFILEQKASLLNLSMLNMSPYTIDTIGTFFPNGSLDYSSQLKLGDARIDMDNNFIFTGEEIITVEGELAEELNNQLPIPLNVALPLLREHNGSIDLNVPIKGKLSHFNVGVTDIIVTALSKGIAVAVTPYLAYTVLGPMGALAFVGAEVGHSLLTTHLPVLTFEPGVRELTPKHKKKLEKLGETIKNHSEIRYSICAQVTLDESSTIDTKNKTNQEILQNEAMRKESFELGEQRSLLVKDYLLSNFEIDEERLLICNPGIHFVEGSKPTVAFKEFSSKLK